MKRIITLFVVVLLCPFLNSTAENKNNKEKNLLFIGETVDRSTIKTGEGVSISIVKSTNGNAVKMQWKAGTSVPKVTFLQGKDKWKLSNYKFISVDVTNQGKEDIFVESRPQQNGWLGGGQIIRPGETRAIRAYILRVNEYPSYLDKKFIGMDALPGGIVKAFWWSPMYPDSINNLDIVVIDPPSNTSLLIANIRGEGFIDPPSESELDNNYFPMIDEFGQFKYKEWPGKIHSMDELIKSKNTELADIKNNPAPEEWNSYGGWLNGPKLKATGHFRTQKVDGKWWLVDPEGRLFWSHGIASVSIGGATPITNREHYFTNLPDSAKEGKGFFTTRTRNVPKGHYKGMNTITSFDQFRWNLLRKYGEDYESEFRDITLQRVKSWGMNSFGNFTSYSITKDGKIPFTGSLGTGRAKRIEGSQGPWTKFPDPFDNSFREALQSSARGIEESAKDPFCLGYFCDNELYWGSETYLAKAVIQSVKDQPAKLKFREFLEKKYKTISELNKKWKMSFKSWEDFLQSTALPVPEPPLVFGSSTKSDGQKTKIIKAYSEDTKAFSAIIANEYFRIVKETLSKTAPQCLYLGCRFDFHYYPKEDLEGDWIVKIGSKYCDVISFNRYRYSAGDLKPSDADVPVIVGEWHMGSMDRGPLHYSLKYAEDQQNRSEMYEYYVKSCLKNPYIVGSHWFRYQDEHVLGRADGENYNDGFVDNCDIPYPEMVNASRKMGRSIYSIRYSNNSDLSTVK